MIEVDPQKRISLQEVFRHPWGWLHILKALIILFLVTGGTKGEPELELPISQVVQVELDFNIL
jgi:hypothetical protein